MNAQANMVAQGIKSFTRWARWQNRGQDGASIGGKLVCLTCSFQFDCLGRCTATLWQGRLVSVEDFDEQLDKVPSSCDIAVRPFMAALGDHRRGRELLEDAKDDESRHKFCNLQKTTEGMLLLQRLAHVVGTGLGVTLRRSLMSARMLAQRLQAEKGFSAGL